MKRIAVIGLGNMGMGIAKNLVEKGFAVSGYARRPAIREAFERIGGRNADSAADAARDCDVAFLMVMNGAQVLDIVGEGIADVMPQGGTVIVTSTIGRSAMLRAAGLLAPKGIAVLDSPVSGGKGGADAGTLTLMVSGSPHVLAAHRDVLEAIGSKIYHVGNEIGQGQVVKACLQAMIGTCFEALFEAMVLGAKAGVDAELLATVINSSFVASNLTSSTTPRILERKFTNGGAHIGTMHKDFSISLDMARELGVPMPAASVAMQMFQAGITAIPDGDNWCIVQLLEKLAATEVRRIGA